MLARPAEQCKLPATVCKMGSKPVERGVIALVVRSNLRRIREERRHSLRSLADRMREMGRSVLPSALGKMESGERRIDVDDLVALAAALRVPVPELFRLFPDGVENAHELNVGLGGMGFTAEGYEILVGLRRPDVREQGGAATAAGTTTARATVPTPTIETEHAMPLGRTKRRTIGTATETDEALPLALDEARVRMVKLLAALRVAEQDFDEASEAIARAEGEYPGDELLAAAMDANLRQTDLRREIARMTNAIADMGEFPRG